MVFHWLMLVVSYGDFGGGFGGGLGGGFAGSEVNELVLVGVGLVGV